MVSYLIKIMFSLSWRCVMFYLITFFNSFSIYLCLFKLVTTNLSYLFNGAFVLLFFTYTNHLSFVFRILSSMKYTPKIVISSFLILSLLEYPHTSHQASLSLQFLSSEYASSWLAFTTSRTM